MRVTRTGRGALAVLGLLAVCTVLFAQPLVLLGVVLVGGWVVAVQVAFTRTLRTLRDDLSVSLEPAREGALTDEPVPVVFTAERTETETDLTISVAPPASADEPTDAPTLTLSSGEERVDASFSLVLPVAGRHTTGRPTATVTSAFGVFEETLPVGDACTLTVRSRLPRDVHVGQGGVRATTPYGGHAAERWGAGVDPADVREYNPGDPASRIDWRTTARLDTPYIREAESTTERQTTLFIDHRATTGVGRQGETALDYLRESALAVLETVETAEDPLSYYAVGDDGVTDRETGVTTHVQYPAVERKLQGLTPTAGDTATREVRRRTPLARSLRGDDSAFERTLHPYVASGARPQNVVADDPLYRAAKTFATRYGGQHWHLLFTDDAHREELRRTVNLLRHGDDHVIVFLAPRALYEPDALVDIDDAYAAYSEFNEFRKRLGDAPRVETYEVAPGSRLETVLASRRGRRVRV
ncbi:DUF58 domain-containing protein [Halarchaeum sp. P4]|uniref:DUF58 domain-containing protein n=1 Tax=Halarchaeum sp. P4 TaxID=3421639 RepID=UPI003EBDCD80